MSDPWQFAPRRYTGAVPTWHREKRDHWPTDDEMAAIEHAVALGARERQRAWQVRVPVTGTNVVVALHRRDTGELNCEILDPSMEAGTWYRGVEKAWFGVPRWVNEPSVALDAAGGGHASINGSF